MNNKNKSFIVEDHSAIKPGTYYVKEKRKIKDLLITVENIKIVDGEKHLCLKEKVKFKDEFTDIIPLKELDDRKIAQISQEQMKIPKEEFTDYLHLVSNIVNLKGLPINIDEKYKEVNKSYWLCTVDDKRYIVNKNKFREYIKEFYKKNYNIDNYHFLSTSSELFKTDYEIDYYSYLITKDVTNKVLNIKKRWKQKSYEEIENHLSSRFKNLYKEDGFFYGIDDLHKTEQEINHLSMLKSTLCKFVFALSSQNINEYLENIKNPDVLYKKYKDNSILPIFIQCSQFVHYDKNLCRLLNKSYPFTKDNLLHLSTGHVVFNLYFADIDFSSLSKKDTEKVFKIFGIQKRYEELITNGTTKEEIYMSLINEDIDISLLLVYFDLLTNL